MEVSRLQVRPETFQLAERPMSRKRKTQLREELIVEYIKTRPYGERVQMKQLQRAAQFKSPQSAHHFVGRMVREGKIVRHNIGLASFFYTVPGELKVTSGTGAPPRKFSESGKLFSAQDIEQQAKDFSWENPDYQNDLRRFIQGLKGDKA